MKDFKEKLDVFNLTRLSHDLIAPLNSIRSIINLAKTEVADKKILKYFKMIEDCSNVLDSNVKETLKAISEDTPVKKTDLIDFDLMVEYILAYFAKVKDYKDIKFNISIENKKPFYSELRFLTSIFQNLIENAIKYRDLKKPETQIGINVCDQGRYIKIIISDNGIGIKKKDQRKVFLKSFRANNPEVSGNGMGLYLIKRTIEILSGKIKLESIPDFGTVFTLLIPNDQMTNDTKSHRTN